MAVFNKVETYLKATHETIKRSGYRSVSIKSLMNSMGYSKRSPKNIALIDTTLRKSRLYIYPKITMGSRWTDLVRIYGFPVESLGDLFESEAELEGFIHAKRKFMDFGVTKVELQYSPLRTRDRLDMKGYDQQGNLVVLEFKNKDGGKSAVEQVLRYMGMLKSENPKKSVRGILVTGIRGVDTAKAMYGMKPEDLAIFKWYLYKYNRAAKSIAFQEVTESSLQRLLRA